MFDLPWFKKKRSPVSDLNLRYQQALALQQSGGFAQAILLYQEILESLPGNPELLRMLGVAECQRGHVRPGLDWLRKAECIDPDNVHLQVNLGLACLTLGELPLAEQHLSHALQLDPESVDAHFNLGNLFDATGDYQGAGRCFETCVRLRGNADDYLNLAGSYLRRGLPDQALPILQQAFALAPNRADIAFVLGNALFAREERAAAIDAFDEAIRLAPDRAAAHWNKAIACLSVGHLGEGWKEFQWRPGVANFSNPGARNRLWLGNDALVGKTLLVVAEHGQGDVLQFCRYLPELNALGVRLIFETQASLVTLMRDNLSCEVIEKGGSRPPFDYYCPLLSLPYALLGHLGETIPSVAGYLRPDPHRVQVWQERLRPYGGFRVGLVWSSGFHPGDPDSWEIYARRNIPLAELMPLKQAGAQFFSLQVGDAALEQLATLRAGGWPGPEIVDWSAELHDFADTAALMACLDLVISVDTSVIHLAGALGKTAWLLNRRETCWRWGVEGASSPWYASIRIFRQAQAGDWSGVIHQVTEELIALVDQSVNAPRSLVGRSC